jgi:hypothetical protein
MNFICSFNDLSNDLLFEIFDYLDVFDLFQAFFNLNQHFNSLIIDRHISFKSNMISLKTKHLPIYTNIILPYVGSYLRYLTISDEFGCLQIILRTISLRNLQVVKLYHVKINELKRILECCQLKHLFIDTNYIQYEKHLNEIFHIVFNQQLDLRSIQCHFHTNLYFVEEKMKLSKLKRVIINCECLSSDFIVLISQLPELRYLSARINDYNRENMDKDIDHLTGNDSVRSLILHIENVELNRLKLILILMPNVHIFELNGTTDSNIDHLFELKRDYTSFRCNLKYNLTF